MSGIRLHASSEVSAVSVAMEGTDFPTRFLINVSGVDPSGNEAKWQVLFCFFTSLANIPIKLNIVV